MLTHQAKRLQSPSVLITNHDAAIMPNFLVKADPLSTDTSAPLVPLRFDRQANLFSYFLFIEKREGAFMFGT
jgi:hypothetical protein